MPAHRSRRGGAGARPSRLQGLLPCIGICIASAVAGSAKADPATSSKTPPTAIRAKLGNVPEPGSIVVVEVPRTTVLGLEVMRDGPACVPSSDKPCEVVEAATCLTTYALSRHVGLRGDPYSVDLVRLSGGQAPDAARASGSYWLVSELAPTLPSLSANSVSPPFNLLTIPAFKAFQATCVGPYDEVDACIEGVSAEIVAKDYEQISFARVERLEAAGEIKTRSKITIPVRSKTSAAPAQDAGKGSPRQSQEPAAARPPERAP